MLYTLLKSESIGQVSSVAKHARGFSVSIKEKATLTSDCVTLVLFLLIPIVHCINRVCDKILFPP